MTWRDELMQALKNKDAEALRRLGEIARDRYHPVQKPKFDYKRIESEGREDD